MHFTLPTAILLAVSALEAAALPKAATTMEKRYNSGWCGVHITQYQKNEKDSGNNPQYQLEITLYDALKANIGGAVTTPVTPSAPLDVDSQLPDVFEVTVGFVDSDPIQFHYGGQFWESTGGQCSFGGFQNGNRDGDCGFTC